MPPRKNKQKEEERKQKELDEEAKQKEIEEKNRIATFAKIVEDQLVIAASTNNNLIKITHHTIVIIDDISVDIFVAKENDKKNKYSYYITNNKLKSSSGSDDSDDDIKFLELEDVSTLVELLTHLEEVKKTYRFIEHKLVSPSEYEFAKNQRIFFPIPSDKCCSICYDSTIEYSICNHPICFKCRIKCIFSDKDSCPLCRVEKISIFPDILTYVLDL